jgi:hypothetical protein
MPLNVAADGTGGIAAAARTSAAGMSLGRRTLPRAQFGILFWESLKLRPLPGQEAAVFCVSGMPQPFATRTGK